VTFKVSDDDPDRAKDSRRANLEENGATPEEIAFLMGDDDPDCDERTGKRVELNAMTSAQFIGLIERKLAEHGVRKVIPDKERLADAYRLFVRSDRTKAIVEAAIAGMADEPIAVPRDLDKQVRAILRKEPALSWETAVRKVLAKR